MEKPWNRSAIFIGLGVLFPIAVVWVGEFVFSLATGRSFELVAEMGPRISRTIMAGLPFVLTGLIISLTGPISSRASSDTKLAGVAEWVAAGVVFGGASLSWGVYFYSAATLRFGRTAGTAFSGALILTAPVWLTSAGVTAFAITKRLLREKRGDQLD